MKYTYGPVLSRRLGISLGVSLVPRKFCSFNCIYCQLGRTTSLTVERKEYVPIDEVLREVEETLKELNGPLDYISLSGSGEPTLNTRIGELIKELKRLSPHPIAVITNGSLLSSDQVKEDLLLADAVLPSLDAATESVFETINRPHPSLRLSEILKGLMDFRRLYKGKLWLEVLFCRGINDNPYDLDALKEAIEAIDPDLVHLNTVSRPGAEEYAHPVSHERLTEIAKRLGPKAVPISPIAKKSPSSLGAHLKERILQTLRVRPLTLEEMCEGLGIDEKEALAFLKELITEGKVASRIFGKKVFYEALANS